MCSHSILGGPITLKTDLRKRIFITFVRILLRISLHSRICVPCTVYVSDCCLYRLRAELSLCSVLLVLLMCWMLSAVLYRLRAKHYARERYKQHSALKRYKKAPSTQHMYRLCVKCLRTVYMLKPIWYIFVLVSERFTCIVLVFLYCLRVHTLEWLTCWCCLR